MNDTTGADAPLLALMTDIAIIHQLTTSAATRVLAPWLGMSEYGLLNHMVRLGDGETPSRLARAFQVSKPSMTATISKLAGKGYVAVGGDAEDARSKRIFLLDAGRAAHREGRQRLAALQGQLFDGFDTAPLLAQAETIAALRAHLDWQRNARDGLA